MTDFEYLLIDLFVLLDLFEFVRLVFMLYAKFKPFFSKKKKGGK